jgi:uncharacterized membrane protein
MVESSFPSSGVPRPGPIEDGVERVVIWPHRSLPRGGARVLVCSVALVFTVVAAGAAAAGAWPMVLYPVLAACAFAWAICASTRRGRMAQVIELAPDAIRVTHCGPAAPNRPVVAFNPIWVRVVEVPGAWNERRVILRESGRSIAIGDFLSPEERARLAAELRQRIAVRYFGAE